MYLHLFKAFEKGTFCLRRMTGIYRHRVGQPLRRTQLKAVIYRDERGREGGRGKKPRVAHGLFAECAQTVSITSAIHVQKGFVRGKIRKRVHGLRGVTGGGMQMRGSPGIYSADQRTPPRAHAHRSRRRRKGRERSPTVPSAESLLL